MLAIKHGSINGNLQLTMLNISTTNLRENAEIIGFTMPFTKIGYLNIANNHIPAEITKFILQTIPRPYPWKTLCIYGNLYNVDCARLLKQFMRSNALLCDVYVTEDMEIIRNCDLEFEWFGEKFRKSKEC